MRTKVLDKESWVYVLKCPTSGEVRYVGWTGVSVTSRFKAHKKEIKNSWKSNWIQSLLPLEPVVEIVEAIAAGEDWQKRERHWIKFHKESGAKLTNLTEGGEGSVGWNPSTETRAKLSAKSSGTKNPFYGKKHSEETRRFISENQKGRKLTEEQKRKIGNKSRGHKHTPEAKAKISAALSGPLNIHYGKPSWNHGLITSEETRRKQSEIKKGKPLTEGHKLKVSASLKGKPKSAEHCQAAAKARIGKKRSPDGAKAMWAKRTPEEKAAIYVKAWETKRQKRVYQVLKEKGKFQNCVLDLVKEK